VAGFAPPTRTATISIIAVVACLLTPAAARAFCGFYVASGEAKLFNHASQVVLVRNEDRTVMTMNSDFKGEPQEFAIVVPVPTVLKKEQVHVADPGLVAHLDAYSAPRLVEYFDENPCAMAVQYKSQMMAGAPMMALEEISVRGGRADAVKIEAQYTVGEYDILILSATQSTALERWLVEHHYRIPPGASRVLGIYIKQDMKFFVAKVNLKEKKKLGFEYLRPIQVAYESPKFMLPIRLGMVNADGSQELFVYALTRNGRVETTNYRTVKLPSDKDVPEFVKAEFADFYRALFGEQVRKNDMTTVFTEYAWDMGWCDPCASAPLTQDELRELGVFWVSGSGQPMRGGANSGSTFITRLHLRYDRDHFPEDLVFQETADQSSFQGRFIIRHEWKGTDDCGAAEKYIASLPERREKAAKNLAELTGWTLDDIRGKMAVTVDWSTDAESRRPKINWWDRLWKK
jgi:hypothetical protein